MPPPPWPRPSSSAAPPAPAAAAAAAAAPWASVLQYMSTSCARARTSPAQSLLATPTHELEEHRAAPAPAAVPESRRRPRRRCRAAPAAPRAGGGCAGSPAGDCAPTTRTTRAVGSAAGRRAPRRCSGPPAAPRRAPRSPVRARRRGAPRSPATPKWPAALALASRTAPCCAPAPAPAGGDPAGRTRCSAREHLCRSRSMPLRHGLQHLAQRAWCWAARRRLAVGEAAVALVRPHAQLRRAREVGLQPRSTRGESAEGPQYEALHFVTHRRDGGVGPARRCPAPGSRVARGHDRAHGTALRGQ
eukprot:scaffold685_cov324-Prasinococcus_capsulatus_cf.AAC.7